MHDPESLHADGITIAWIPLDLHHSRDSSPCDLGLDLLTWSESGGARTRTVKQGAHAVRGKIVRVPHIEPRMEVEELQLVTSVSVNRLACRTHLYTAA